MTKREFMRLYKTLTAAERADVKKYWEDVYMHAIFPETLTDAERRLLWMKEAEA